MFRFELFIVSNWTSESIKATMEHVNVQHSVVQLMTMTNIDIYTYTYVSVHALQNMSWVGLA